MLAAGLETEHHRNHDSERGVAGEATRLAVTRVPVKVADETREPLSHQPIQAPRGEASAGGSSKGADGLGAEDSEVPVGRGSDSGSESPPNKERRGKRRKEEESKSHCQALESARQAVLYRNSINKNV